MTRKTILLVEDERAVREILTSVLEAQGYSVLTAEDGAAGWSQLQGGEPALILLDMQLPRLSGWEFVKKAQAAGVKAPIIAISAVVPDEEVQSRDWIDDFLPKPFDLDTLLQKVEARMAHSP